MNRDLSTTKLNVYDLKFKLMKLINNAINDIIESFL